MDKHAKGALGEEIAKSYLEEQGFTILEHNFSSKTGEVDLIARHRGEFYFIEVKTRWSTNYGDPLESVTLRKQQQVIRGARYYLARNRMKDTVCHLSAIGVDLSGGDPKIEFVPDAFEI